MISTYIELLLGKLRDKQDTIVKSLTSNAVKDMEQYRLLNGRLQGLEEGICLVGDVYKSLVETETIEHVGNKDRE